MSSSFQEAYSSARSRYSDEQWYALPMRDQSEAIYREMRRLDAEAVRQSVTRRRSRRTEQSLEHAA
jgi:hypothetical protein